MPFPVVVLISGSGTNLQAIIDAQQDGKLGGATVACVISNRADAYGLERAKNAGIPTQILQHTNFASRDDYDRELMALIDPFAPRLIILAGFMRILSANFVNHYLGRLINIHPSLLPRYKGLHTHKRALDAGDTEHGCSVHIVTPELDGGPIIAQACCAIAPDETEASLMEKVHELEHQLYPAVIRQFAEGTIRWENDQLVYTRGEVSIDGNAASHRPLTIGQPR